MIDKVASQSRRSVWLAVSALLTAYIGTTGLGAAFFPSEFGESQLAAFLWPESIGFDTSVLGSATYWLILLSIVLITPAVALLSGSVASKVTQRIVFPQIPLIVPITLAGIMAAFCAYKLAGAGALSALDAFDRSTCYDEKILRRGELIGLLGNRFYSFAYSSLPILGCYFLARGVREKDLISIASCIVLSAVVLWFNIAIFFKSAAVIYVGMLGATLWLSGVGILRCASITAVSAIALYTVLSLTQFCDRQVKSWERTIPPITTTAPDQPQATQQPQQQKPQEKGVVYKAGYMVRAALFRMASGFPYYIDTFSTPTSRCGIVRPPSPWWSQQTCFPPITVFKKMYPGVTYTTGYQPAPLNVSAYAEAGPWYVLFATIACGIILGVTASLARDRGPLSITIVVASCIYAYYATQSSLTGSLIDSYGLLWLLLPIGLMVSISAMIPRLSQLAGRLPMDQLRS